MPENMDNFIPRNTVTECNRCIHRKPFEFWCEAFPEGIPEEILDGRRHKTPFPGDHGILFEKRPDRD